jgi:deoxyribonuclease IV
MLQIGYHIRGQSELYPEERISSILSHLKHACKVDKINSAQIFLKKPNKPNVKEFILDKGNKHVSEFRKFIDDNNINLIIHGQYTINFARPPDSFQARHSRRSLIHDAINASTIGAVGVIFHVGKNVLDLPFKEVIENMKVNIEMTLYEFKKRAPSVKLVLENGAGQGTECCIRFDELALLYSQIKKNLRDTFRFCIDTCHLWVSGTSIRTKREVDEFFGKIDRQLGGIKNIIAIHFNDSKYDLGMRVDGHEDISFGFISNKKLGGSLDGFKEIAKIAKKHGIFLILETPATHYIDTSGKRIRTANDIGEQIKMVKKWV